MRSVILTLALAFAACSPAPQANPEVGDTAEVVLPKKLLDQLRSGSLVYFEDAAASRISQMPEADGFCARPPPCEHFEVCEADDKRPCPKIRICRCG